MTAHRSRCATFALTMALASQFALLHSSPVFARDVKLSGMGIRKCAEWQQWKEDKQGEPRAMALEWTQGFIAGHNVYARSGTEAAASVVADTKVLIPLLDNYCQKNPDSRIFSAVIEITQSLGGAKVNLSPKAVPQQNPTPPRSGSKKEFES
jgi:hypothetical protein